VALLPASLAGDLPGEPGPSVLTTLRSTLPLVSVPSDPPPLREMSPPVWPPFEPPLRVTLSSVRPLPTSVSLSPLYSNQTNDLHVSTSFEPSPEFPLASPCSSIGHHLSGPSRYALTQIFFTSDDRSIVPWFNPIPTFYFHYAQGFCTHILAYVLDSLVRVTRRVDRNHFVNIVMTHKIALSQKGVSYHSSFQIKLGYIGYNKLTEANLTFQHTLTLEFEIMLTPSR